MCALKCLLIDDDYEESEIFNFAADELTIPVRCQRAASGRDAIDGIAEGRFTPDIIFLDLYMPRMDGKECLASLKSLPGIDAVPVIIYSTGMTDHQRDELVRLGADGFLEKTTNIPDLTRELDAAFAARRSATALARA